MLTLVHATEGLSTSREALEYKDKAITSLQSTLGALDLTFLESTMGAILLLAGFEVRDALFLLLFTCPVFPVK